jgi:hypothetical protein
MTILKIMKYLACAAAALFVFLGSMHGTENPPKYGEVKPLPHGCLYMAFIDPKDDTHCIRSKEGQITKVVSPTGRIEMIYQPHYSPGDFEKLVKKNPFQGYFPGNAAWQYVKKYIKPADEVHIFGILDQGFVVIRNNRIFCLVITAHNM